MAFWRTETMRERVPIEQLIDPYNAEYVKHGAYQLCMGAQAFITSTEDNVKIELAEGQSLSIPPGQFALLLTQERIKIPTDAIAFISMRFGVKRRGLVNVSGFHVDPGFEGRLKFSVYNAGSNPITITRGDQLFLIWYAGLDGQTKVGYGAANTAQNIISSDDQNAMHGEIASPAELKSQLDTLRHLDVHRKWMLGVIAAALVTIAVRLVMDYSAVNRMKVDIMAEVRRELAEVERKYATPIRAGHQQKQVD